MCYEMHDIPANDYLFIFDILFAVDCPNITCFRCGAFGHHSRSCPREGGGYRPKPILCTNCSDFAHDKRYCQSMLSQICDKINNSSDIVCMCCQQKGHVMCLHLGNFNPRYQSVFMFNYLHLHLLHFSYTNIMTLLCNGICVTDSMRLLHYMRCFPLVRMYTAPSVA